METKKQLRELFEECLELMSEEEIIGLSGILQGILYRLKKKQD